MLYIVGKGIGWATIEPNFIEIHLRISLQTLCENKHKTEKFKGPIFPVNHAPSQYKTI